MQLRKSNRWALAYADLSLLLLGFMALQNMGDSQDDLVEQSKMSSGKEYEFSVTDLFHNGEAMMTDEGRSMIVNLNGAVSGPVKKVSIKMVGIGPASTRMDGWEIAAARLASLGRSFPKEYYAVKLDGIEESDSKQQVIIHIEH